MKWSHSRSAFPFWLILAVILLAPDAVAQAPSGVVAEFAVHSGRFDRVDVPVSASLEGVPLHLHTGVSLQLYEITGGSNVPVASQVEPGDPRQLTWILEGETAPGVVRNYILKAVAEAPALPGQRVNLEDDGESLQVNIGEKPVLAYRYVVQPVPEGVDDVFSRSGFIHPFWSPGGEVLSRIQPPDHYHHYGIWNPWTHTEFEGREIDFWNLGKGQGTVRAEQIIERTGGPLSGGFKALLSHVDFTGNSGEQVAMTEQLEIKVWNVDPEQKVWLVDFVSTLNPATEEPLTIKAYRYQGFSLRATEKWNDETATLLSSEGFDKSNANATRARWLDVKGVSDVAEGTSGILFMSHPGNHSFPEELRIWPVGANRGVENVYINFNPAQSTDWVLAPGNAYTLKYRMLVYDGSIEVDQAERYWRDFANPPTVDVHPVGALAGAKVLVYTKNGEGYVHDNIPFTIEAIRKLGTEYGFEVDASEDPGVFTEDNLAQYDALIFSNTNNETFDTDAQREALQAYVRKGGGFVGIHSASGSERDWPWFSQLLGGNFERHAPRQDFTVEIVDRTHPSTSFLPDTWDIVDDECYYQDELNPRINVLLAADLSTVRDVQKGQFPGELFGERFPLAWYQEFDGGRQWYTALGHRSEHYSDPQFMRHILGGIQWAVNGVSP